MSDQSQAQTRAAAPADLATLQTRRDLISHWMGLVRSTRLYEPGNDSVLKIAERILACVKTLAGESGDVELLVRHQSIFVSGERVRESALVSSAYHGFVDLLARAEITAVRVDAGVSPREIDGFGRLLAEVAEGARSPEEIEPELAVRAISGLELVRAGDAVEEAPLTVDREQITKRVYMRSISVVKGVFHSAAKDGRVSGRMVKRVVQQMIESVDQDYLLNLSSLKNYDEYTFNHSVNVSVLAIALGRHVGLSRRQLYVLGQAGMLHDLGKLCVPRDVLNKPGKLTPEERTVIESHPAHGFITIASSLGVTDDTIPVALAAFQHHVNLNGTGYPQSAVGGAIGLLSRLVAIVDRYDAMTSARAYRRQPIPPWKALAIMYHRHADQFDRPLLRYFMNLLGLYPLGTCVQLSDGSIALVVGGNHEAALRHLPLVRLVLDADGEPAASEVIDLAARVKEDDGLRVAQVVNPEDYAIEMMDYLL